MNDPSKTDLDIAGILAWRAQNQPDRLALRYEAGGASAGSWEERYPAVTYRELHWQALAVAAELGERAQAGSRVILALDSGMDFVASFFGCLYAEMIALPVPVPRAESDRLRWDQLVQDAAPSVVLTAERHHEGIENLGTDRVSICVVDRLSSVGGDRVESSSRTDEIAFLQYTSGSTGDPKGVAVSFGNLSHNLEQIRRRFGHTAESRGVIWLPPFHDMGLIGGILQPIYVGFPVVLMQPLSFIRHPFRWLEAISEFRATTSGGPNFAYEHALKRIPPERRAELDLSCWSVAFVGAERVRPDGLRKFAETFNDCGFKEAAFLPCYGLAESTLMVSAGQQGFGLRESEDSNVSCGPVADDLDVKIVDPESKDPVTDGSAGEVWVSGTSIAAGYWNREEESRETFQARLNSDDSKDYLRTGDLGFMRDSELYISGRLKDLIVIRGQNYVPTDLEHCAITVADLATDSVAAFAVDDGNSERLIVIYEARRKRSDTEAVGDIAAKIRSAISTQYFLTANEVAAVKTGDLPRTTSGKLRRAKCRELFVADDFEFIARFPLESATEGNDRTAASKWEQRLTTIIARKLKVDEPQLPVDRPLAELGVDSVMAVEIAAELTEALGLAEPLEPTLAWRYPTIAALGKHLESIGQERSETPMALMKTASSDEPIAIVGISCRFPGGVDSPEAFWQLLEAGRDAVTQVPADRWDADQLFDPDPDAPGKIYTRDGAFIDGVADFDPAFFNISPREANLLDPQQRLLLEGTYLALADAGYEPFKMHGSRTGVFVGLSLDDYAQLTIRSGDTSRIDQQSSLGSLRGVAAGRIAYVFGLQGPVMQLDTTCSSSLVSVHLACQSLRQGDADLAMAGGVNLMLTPEASIACCKLRALSPEGRCFTFAEKADGYVRGEGCGMVALQRLSDAVADGRQIYGVIRGSTVNHDGVSNGLTAPNVTSQISLYQQALQSAGLNPNEIDYLEAHGTGTPLGDPIEIEGIDTVFGNRSSKLMIGSVKTNIGHLEAAAGIASLIKTVLAMQEGSIPPHLHADELSSRIDWEKSCTAVVTASREWPEGIRRAGVSSFGLSGTNAHLILERPNNDLVRTSFKPVSIPFNRKRCWVGMDEANEPPPLRRVALAGESIHGFEGFVRPEDWSGHRVQGKALLPATGQLWLINHALREIDADRDWRIRNTELQDALWLENQAVAVQLHFTGQANEEFDFKFYGKLAGEWRELSRGQCTAQPQSITQMSPPSNGETIDAGDFYARCEKRGLRYSGEFQQVSQIELAGDTARGSLNDIQQTAALWDAGLQVAGALLKSDSLVVPAHVAEFRVHRDSSQATYALAKRDGEYINVQWQDHEDNVVAELRGLSLLPLGKQFDDTRSPYFEIVWNEEPLDFKATEQLEQPGHSTGITERQEHGSTQLILPKVSEDESIPGACERITTELLDHVQSFLKSKRDHRLYVAGLVHSTGDKLVHAAVWGLLQTLAIEHPALHATLVASDDWGNISREILADAETLRVKIFNDQRLVASWKESPPENRLVIESPGSLDELKWKPHPRSQPKPDEVLIAVEAAGLNFRDVLVAMGLYPDPAELGCECAGVVIKVGSAVKDLKPGDRVMAIGAGCFADTVTVTRSLAVKITDALESTQATAIPVAYCTAYHSLVTLGKLQAGESVLIHAATGGVGQAAIRIAQSIGARVFATASPHKWPRLKELGVTDIHHSRTSEFADAILQATENRGVDVVLNTLPGEGRARSLDATAQGGRLIEIGKGCNPDEMRSARPDIGLHVFDLSTVCREEPETVQQMLADAATWESTSEIETFAWNDTIEAFRRMQSGQHLGKLVVQRNAKATDLTASPVLITGGLGGLGLVTANWLIDHGTRHLLLLSRNGIQTDEQKQAVERLRGRGATIEIIETDVTDQAKLADSLKPYLEADSPTALRGVIHAAGSLSDGLIEKQSPESIQQAFGPKVTGAWNLHELTRGLPLEYFVLYSSAAGVFGAPGQANHAAANSFLDGLARERTVQGLPGLSIAWGPWSGIGSAVQYGKDGFLREIPGIRMIDPENAAQHLDATWACSKPVITVLPVDWSSFDADRWNAGFRRSSPATVSTQDRQSSKVTDANELERLLTKRIGKVLGIASGELDREKGFFDLGIDSLTALELKTQLERDLGFELPTTLIFDYPTPAALLGHLSDKLFSGNAPVRSAKPASIEQTANEPIAIVGMSCRFPGDVNNPIEFWEFLTEGRDGIGLAPADRWDVDAFHSDTSGEPGKIITKVGGFLDNLDQFDASFFSITPKEAATMDPQQRLLLEGSWEAMTHAGVTPEDWSGEPIGVFVGISGQDYSRRLMDRPREEIDAYLATGNSHSVAAGRLSYTFGFTGPSFAVDTACSSSLVAVHQACQSLRSGECKAAIAAGVNCILTPDLSITFSQAQMLSPTGKCHTFAAAADGFVRSEGCGTIILKRLSGAEADGDNVLAIIRGSAINQDGRSGGLTVPNGPSQQSVIRNAIAQAGIEAKDVHYVEAHGTGTELGDPVELNALAEVFSKSHSAERPLRIGSLKTNLGHMEAAAGIGGLLKVVLALQHKTLPKHLHFDTPSPHVPWDQMPLRVTAEQEPWNADAKYAGVSSFGFSGTNAHIILERSESATIKPAPANPYQRRRHWVDTVPERRATIAVATPHPLLAGELELARSSDRYFELSDSLFQNPLWQEHRVFDQPVFPAVGFLELFCAAYRQCEPAGTLTLKDVSFAQVLSLRERGGPMQLIVASDPQRIELAQKGENNEWQTLSQASYDTSPSESTKSAEPASKECNPAAVYERLADQDVTYGDHWRIIESLATGENQVTAKLRRATQTSTGFHFDPVVLDACVQSIAALFIDDEKPRTYLPEGVGEVTFYSPNLPGDTWTSHVQITTGEDWLSADIVLLDESGKQVVAMRDFRLRPVDDSWREALIAKEEVNIEDWFYTLEWRSEPLTKEISLEQSSLAKQFSEQLAKPENQEHLKLLPDLDRHAASLAAKVISEINRDKVLPTHAAMLAHLDATAAETTDELRGKLESTFAQELVILERVTDQMPQILAGEADAMDALFPGGDTSDLTWLYEQSPGARLLNTQALRTIEQLSADRPLRILEVGGGTGGTTTALASSFANLTEYVFTDISPLLVHRAKERFGKHPNLRFETLDIEQGLAGQGFGENKFDVIVAANVLHATKSLPQTLDHLRDLTTPGGYLLLIEGTRPMVWLDMVFGVTKGWWAFDDELRSGHPLLDEPAWHKALKEHDFEVLSVTDDSLPHAVFIARKDVAADLPEEVVFDATSLEGTFESQIQTGLTNLLQTTQAIIQKGPPWPQLTIVTKGAIGANCHHPEQAAVWGLGHTIELEYPELRCRRVDLDPFLSPEAQVEILESERHNRSTGAISYRDGQRLVARLEHPESVPRLEKPTEQPFRIRRQGENELELVESDRRPPADNEVEIRVDAAGFNFIDGLDIAGLLPFEREWLGVECAGEIVSVGSQVDEFQTGDRVIALAPGTFQKFVTVSAKLVTVWERDGATDATTLPANYLTAEHALRDVAKLQDGERLLIHAAAGGTGIAAVQVAKKLGAEVFATASRGKWQFLRDIGVEHIMDSRQLDFADEIQKLTEGKGVDVVLNSLSGDYISHGLQSLAPKGRFIELGKRGIWTAEQVAELRGDVEYHVVDLLARSEAIASGAPDLPDSLFKDFSPNTPLPKTVFPIEETPRAARYFQRSKHIGKVVLNLADSSVPIREDASYLITGGLGGLGIETCKWLLQNGARHVFLLGRSVTTDFELPEHSNACVHPIRCDVSDRQQVEHALEQVQATAPLRGIVHAAGVLSDATIAELTWNKMEPVLLPKVHGAKHLHDLTQNLTLDFFALYSSGASLLGSPGQGSHVAANAYLDALAHHRRALGLPAQTLNWGPWSKVGSAADAQTQKTLAAQGIGHIDPKDGIAALSSAIQRPDWSQIGILPIDWASMKRRGLLEDPFFENLHSPNSATASKQPSAEQIDAGDWFKALNALPSGQRLPTLVGKIQDELGRVIGLPATERPDPNAGFFDMGIDSLMSVDLKNRLARHLDLEISPTLLFQNPNINALAAKLMEMRFKHAAKPQKLADQSLTEESNPESSKPVAKESAESAIEAELKALNDLLEE
ncbi:MAG: hypothetical protein CMO80_06765 [Verrucomicrobiales bacterium]|nr:hypothetical protein [Verrucomicrobiales bacterium]